MKLSQNSQMFLNKLSSSLDVDIEQAEQMLDEIVNGSRISKIENGEIKELNIRGLGWAKKQILEQSGIRCKLDVPDGSQIDLADLIELVNLDFSSRSRNEVPIPPYDFSPNSKLESIVFRFHKTNSIDISNCSNLRGLDCSSNELKSLNVNSNHKLEKLNCQFNPIKSLDLTTNSKLTYLSANSTDLKNESIQFPSENHISELHLRGTLVNKLDPTFFPDLVVCRLEGIVQDKFNTKNNRQLMQLELNTSQIQQLDISESHFLSEFTARDSKIFEIISNEYQAFAIPILSKQFKLKADPEQEKILETIDLHKKAFSHNWDEGLNKLKKILKNPNCDIATATLIYWMGNPNYYLKYLKVNDAPEYERDHLRFLNKLEKQILNQEFNTKIIDFNPSNFKCLNWVQNSYNPSMSVREIPELLKSVLRGNPISAFDISKKYKGKL